jgi:ABC-type uncharacterized transport system permease subunit
MHAILLVRGIIHSVCSGVQLCFCAYVTFSICYRSVLHRLANTISLNNKKMSNIAPLLPPLTVLSVLVLRML